jgi:SAM-dependent methyltransferase
MTDFQRYLRAKRTVDDRALDRRLFDQLRTELAAVDTDPLRVLEVGAGIGTMITRALDWGLFPDGAVQYTAVDVDEESLAAVGTELDRWASDRPVSVTTGEPTTIAGPSVTVTVERVTSDAVSYLQATDQEWDLLVGAAVLDILPAADLHTLLGALAPGGLWYFPITFDGGTRFRPAHPADRDIERRYHEHMDTKPGGDSRAGATTLAHCRASAGVSVLGVAGSDWVVRPTDGTYPGDERYFLAHILETVETAVRAVANAGFDPTLTDWLDTRRGHLDSGDLLYLTHQLDLLGRVVDPTAVR